MQIYPHMTFGLYPFIETGVTFSTKNRHIALYELLITALDNCYYQILRKLYIEFRKNPFIGPQNGYFCLLRLDYNQLIASI